MGVPVAIAMTAMPNSRNGVSRSAVVAVATAVPIAQGSPVATAVVGVPIQGVPFAG